MTPTAVQEQIRKQFEFLAASNSMPIRSKDLAATDGEEARMSAKERPRKRSRPKK